MDPAWEWQWAYWDERHGCLVETPVWMTDEEARADWHAYDDPRSHRIEHTKRDRNQNDGPPVEAPAKDVDWTRERRQRTERSRYGLPPYVTPLYSELRGIWKAHPAQDVRRLALEVQTGRYELAELEAMTAEAYWYLSKEHATVDEARKALGRIRRRLMQVMQRIGPVKGDHS